MSFFVPLSSFLVEFLYSLFGAIALTVTHFQPRSRSLYWATSYVVGATSVGLVQWLCFFFGISRYSIPVMCAVTCGLLGWLLYQMYMERNEVLTLNPPFEIHFKYFVFLFMAGTGFLIAESSDLHFYDTRFQFAYRTKVISTCENMCTPLLQDPEVLHHNRKYPPLLSAAEAFKWRLLRNSDPVAFRAAGFSWFCVCLLTVLAFAKDLKALIIVALVVVCIPSLWTYGIDGPLADLPIGAVTALAVVFLTDPSNSARVGAGLSFCGLALPGLKFDGAVMAAVVIVVDLLATRRGANWRRLLPFAAGAIACVVFWNIYVTAMPASASTWFTNSKVNHFSQIANIAADMVLHLFNPTTFGLVFPVTIAIYLVLKSKRKRVVSMITSTYVCVLLFAFLTSPFTDVHWHISVTMDRLLLHVLPMNILLLAEYFSSTSKAKTSQRGTFDGTAPM